MCTAVGIENEGFEFHCALGGLIHSFQTFQSLKLNKRIPIQSLENYSKAVDEMT